MNTSKEQAWKRHNIYEHLQEGMREIKKRTDVKNGGYKKKKEETKGRVRFSKKSEEEWEEE